MRKGFVSRSVVSLFCTALFAVALVLTGCSADTLTGPQADGGGDSHNNGNNLVETVKSDANTGAFFGKLVERYGGVGGDSHNNNAPGVGGDSHNNN
ncbi:hypothetical protein [Rhodocaloribacter sp.]